MLSWSLEDIRMFFDSEPTIGRVTLVEKYRSTLNELAYIKDDNSLLFNNNQRVREALEKSIGETRKYQKCYNGLLGLSQKLLECPVCQLKPFTLVLPCGHTLCPSCAEMLKRNDEKTKCGICSRPDFYMITLMVYWVLINIFNRRWSNRRVRKIYGGISSFDELIQPMEVSSDDSMGEDDV